MNEKPSDTMKRILREILADPAIITERDFWCLVDDFGATGQIPTQVDRGQQALSFTAFVISRDDVGKLVARLRDFPGAKNRLEAVTSPNEVVQLRFVNRIKELDLLCSDRYDPLYTLVHAPAGYGKTCLLREMYSQYEKKDKGTWCCIEIRLPSYLGVERLESKVDLVSLKGKVWDALDIESDVDNISLDLASWCNEQNSNIVVFIDDFERLEDEAISWLWNEMTPDLVERLGEGFFYRYKLKWFFFGRYVVDKMRLAQRIRVTDYPLEPFSLNVVYNTISDFATDVLKRSWGNQKVRDLSNYVMYNTGGHPAAIEKILMDWEKTHFSYTIEEYFDKDRVWRTIEDLIRKTINRDLDVDDEFLKVFRKLSGFRHLRYDLIEYLAGNHHISWSESGWHLIDRLLDRRLVTFQDPFFVDSITRQALLLQFRHDHRTVFLEICKGGIEYYTECYRSPQEKEAPQMFIERLYQMAQLAIEDDDARKLLANFLDRDFRMELERLLKDRADKRTPLYALKDKLMKDTELGLMLELSRSDVSINKILAIVFSFEKNVMAQNPSPFPGSD